MADQTYNINNVPASTTFWTAEDDQLLKAGLDFYDDDLHVTHTWAKVNRDFLKHKGFNDIVNRYNELVTLLAVQDSFNTTTYNNNVYGEQENSVLGFKRPSESLLPSSSEPEAEEMISNKKARKKYDAYVHWTTEDEELFRQGVGKHYGQTNTYLKAIRDEFLPHKTAKQINTYNQKYLKRLNKAANATGDGKKVKARKARTSTNG